VKEGLRIADDESTCDAGTGGEILRSARPLMCRPLSFSKALSPLQLDSVVPAARAHVVAVTAGRLAQPFRLAVRHLLAGLDRRPGSPSPSVNHGRCLLFEWLAAWQPRVYLRR
jgi:hypothetical protein